MTYLIMKTKILGKHYKYYYRDLIFKSYKEQKTKVTKWVSDKRKGRHVWISDLFWVRQKRKGETVEPSLEVNIKPRNYRRNLGIMNRNREKWSLRGTLKKTKGLSGREITAISLISDKYKLPQTVWGTLWEKRWGFKDIKLSYDLVAWKMSPI
jgi:hypothetical protein